MCVHIHIRVCDCTCTHWRVYGDQKTTSYIILLGYLTQNLLLAARYTWVAVQELQETGLPLPPFTLQRVEITDICYQVQFYVGAY